MKDRPALLLVDDLPENLFALQEMLKREDVDIFTARSGKEALEILLEHSVALAIIDVQMPEMDGFELAGLIRSVQRTRHLPIIFVTAGSRDEYREFKGYEAGAVDFLFKPMDVHVLRSKVNVFITLERQRKALEVSMAELREAERIREVFIAILGHDLRNPLSAVLLGAQLALRRTEEEAVRDPVRRVLESAERMLRMIDQLLDMKRTQFSTQGFLAPSPCDLRDLLEQAILGAPASRDAIEVEIEGNTQGAWDEDRLFQVMSNLIGNACEHGEKGGCVQVRLDGRAAERVVLEVHNWGPAIPPGMRSALFEPFSSKPGPRRAKKGLGLGLFITKKFVEAHGGNVEVDSSEAEGTTFRVVLPRGLQAGELEADDARAIS